MCWRWCGIGGLRPRRGEQGVSECGELFELVDGECGLDFDPIGSDADEIGGQAERLDLLSIGVRVGNRESPRGCTLDVFGDRDPVRGAIIVGNFDVGQSVSGVGEELLLLGSGGTPTRAEDDGSRITQLRGDAIGGDCFRGDRLSGRTCGDG